MVATRTMVAELRIMADANDGSKATNYGYANDGAKGTNDGYAKPLFVKPIS